MTVTSKSAAASGGTEVKGIGRWELLIDVLNFFGKFFLICRYWSQCVSLFLCFYNGSWRNKTIWSNPDSSGHKGVDRNITSFSHNCV